jgi:hypothetical protein
MKKPRSEPRLSQELQLSHEVLTKTVSTIPIVPLESDAREFLKISPMRVKKGRGPDRPQPRPQGSAGAVTLPWQLSGSKKHWTAGWSSAARSSEWKRGHRVIAPLKQR